MRMRSMHIRRYLFALAALLLVVAGVWAVSRMGLRVGLHGVSLVQDAVISGTVTEGPTMPICRTDTPCTRAVANHAMEISDSRGSVAAHTVTDAQGRYAVQLPPGTYTVTLVPRIGMGRPAMLVVSKGVTHYDITFDSGLR